MATHTREGRKKVSARPKLDWAFKAGKPSAHGINHISELPPGKRAISLCRVSLKKQAPGLIDQEQTIRENVEDGGFYVDLGEENVQMVRSCHPKGQMG